MPTPKKPKGSSKAKKPADPKKPGRPTKFSQKIADEIIERISKGETLVSICYLPHMPDRTTVGDWKLRDKEFSHRFSRARDEGFDAIANDCLEIADMTALDTKENADGHETCDHEWVTRSKLRIETRLKLLAKWDPKRYGERVDLNHGGTGVIKITIGGDA